MNSCKNTLCNLYALHGFLGLSTDWDAFDMINHPVKISHEELDFWKWGHHFASTIKKEGRKNILLGYSLGGRLAMHALLSAPTLWDAAIFVSAHPGLASEEERAARLKADIRWSERFLVDPWDILMRDWNANPVFGSHQFPFPREEKDFDRTKLSKQLLNWSLGNQDSLLPQLEKLSIPLLIVAGEQDKKFCAIADDFKVFSKVAIIPDAAHRVPWDQPDKFINQIKNFIKDI